MARGIVSKELGACPGAKNDAATVAVVGGHTSGRPMLTAAQPSMALVFDLNQDSQWRLQKQLT